MKLFFTSKSFWVGLFCAPLLLQAQEAPSLAPASIPINQPTSAPMSQPSSAPTSMLVTIEPAVIAPPQPKRGPAFEALFGVHSSKKTKRVERGLFGGRSVDGASRPKREEEFQIGVTAQGEVWKIFGANQLVGPFLSMDGLLRRERLNIKDIYQVEAQQPIQTKPYYDEE